jgi:hypothetical protein
MNKEQILEEIKSLSHCQGFYCRLLERLTSGTSEAEEMMEVMVAQNFKDSLEMVLWLEG